MESDEELKFSILSLPTELLVIIASYLSSRDKVKLFYVSQRLQIISEIPSLWHEFVWDYYDTCEELCLMNMFKRCGEHIKYLSFPGYLAPKLEMIKYCNNVKYVSLPVLMTLSPDLITQLGETVQHMKNLHTLDIGWGIDDIRPLLLIGSYLMELSVYIIREQKNFLLTVWVEEWVDKGFKPATLTVTLRRTRDVEAYAALFTEKWQQWNLMIPADHTACLKLYRHFKLSLNLSPVLPAFQLQFGHKALLPFVRANEIGLDCIQLADCCKGGKMLYKASNASLNYLRTAHVASLNFLTHFNVAGLDSIYDNVNVSSDFFLSNHLEQLATECPHLQQLILRGSHQCLRSLQGLRAIASHCHDLTGLDISGISVTEIESQVQVWEILSTMKLTHLGVDLCVISLPASGEEKENVICLYKKCSSLLAVEYGDSFNQTRKCGICQSKAPVKDYLFLSCFPSLFYCKIQKHLSPPIQDIISNCKMLKCCRIQSVTSKPLPPSPMHNVKLQQLHINSLDLVIPNSFMESVSAHGTLVHVFLCVASVTAVGVDVLIQNSPKLTTFQLLPPVKICHNGHQLTQIELLKFKLLLKQKFYQHKLFNLGGCRLYHPDQSSIRVEFLEHTDVGMLWNE